MEFLGESKSDTRRHELVGPVLWGIVQPILVPELEQVIAQMKAGATGPDGMVLGKFKMLPRMLPREELKARYNLWLLLPGVWSQQCGDKAFSDGSSFISWRK